MKNLDAFEEGAMTTNMKEDSFPSPDTVKNLAEAYRNVRIGTVYDAATGLFHTGNVPVIMEKVNNEPGFLIVPRAPTAEKRTTGSSYQSMSMIHNYMDVSASVEAEGTVPTTIPVSARAGAGMYFQNMHNQVEAQKTVSVNCISLVKADWLRIARDNQGNLLIAPRDKRLTVLAQFVTSEMKGELLKFGAADTDEKMAAVYAGFKQRYGTHVVTGVKLVSYAAANMSYAWDSFHEEQQVKHGENVDVTAGIPLVSGGASVATNFLSASTKERVRHTFKVDEKYYPLNGPLAASVREFANTVLGKAMNEIDARAVTAGPSSLPQLSPPPINKVPKNELTGDERAALDKFREDKLKASLERGEFEAWKKSTGTPGATIEQFREWNKQRLEALKNALNGARPDAIESTDLFAAAPDDPFCALRAANEEDLATSRAEAGEWLDNYIIAEVELTPWQKILGLDPKYQVNPITEVLSKIEIRSQQFNILIQYLRYCKRYAAQTHIASFAQGVENITGHYQAWVREIVDVLERPGVSENELKQIGDKFPSRYLSNSGMYSQQFQECFNYLVKNFQYIYRAPFGYAFKHEHHEKYYCDVQAGPDPFRDIEGRSLSDLLFRNKDNTSRNKPQERLMRWYPIVAYSNSKRRPCFVFLSHLYETHPDNAYSDDAHDFDLAERSAVWIYGRELHSDGWWPGFERFHYRYLNEGIASATWNPLKQFVWPAFYRWHNRYHTFAHNPSFFDNDYLDGYDFNGKFLVSLHDGGYFYYTPENGLWFGTPNRIGGRIQLVPFGYDLAAYASTDKGVVGGAMFSEPSLETIVQTAKKFASAI